MGILVHKGNHEIGGTCIQVTSGMTTVLLDVGPPLNAESLRVDVSQVSVDAVLVSQPNRFSIDSVFINSERQTERFAARARLLENT
jgi:hypothetical protein